MTDYTPLPENPPTSVIDQDFYAHQKIIYSAISSFLYVPKPTGIAVQDTAALQTTIDAAIASNIGRTIILYPGTYQVNATLLIRNANGLRIIGNGATQINWAGTAGIPIIKMSHCRENYLSGIQIAAGTAYAGIQILRDNVAPVVWSPTNNHFHQIDVSGGEHAFVVGGIDFVNANNDFNYFDNCRATGYTIAGALLNGSQAYGTVFTNCHFSGTAISSYGVDCGSAGGQFQWYGGSMSNNLIDYRIGRNLYKAYLIEHVNSEGSGRFIEKTDSFRSDIIVQGCRWAGNAPHADGRAIITAGSVHLSMLHCHLGDGGTDDAITIDFQHLTDSAVEIKFLTIYSTASDVWVNAEPLVLFASKRVSNEGLLTTVPLTL